MVSTLLTLTTLLATALALPVNTATPSSSSVSSQDLFTLVARNTSPNPPTNLTVNNFYVTGVHAGAGENLMTLTSNASYASAFYTNGTADQVASKTSNVLMYLGAISQNNPPYGIELSPNSYSAPFGPKTGSLGSIIIGQGLAGVHLSKPAAGKVVELKFRNGTAPVEEQKKGSFMACQTVLYGPIVSVDWRNETIPTPADCTDIELLPVCAGAFAADSNIVYGQESSCYATAPAARKL